MTAKTSVAGALVIVAAGLGSIARSAGAPAESSRFRRPVALATSADGSTLYAANARGGSVSVVDPRSGTVLGESAVGRSLADLQPLPDGRLVAVDPDGDALLFLEADGTRVEVRHKLAVPFEPASVLVAPDGASCVVASTASRTLSIVDTGGSGPKVVRTIALPFSPRNLAWVGPDSSRKLVAADAFGGKLAVVDPGLDRPESIRSLPAHNIRGLAATPDGRSLIVVHQTLGRLARSSFEDVHWGSLLNNHLRILSLDAVLAPDSDLLKGSRVVEIGRVGRAAGDPGTIAFDRRGRMAVALAGVQEVALIADSRSYFANRIPVGHDPSAICPSPEGDLFYVANSLDDSISVVDARVGKVSKTIALGPRPEPGPVERGERLFADAKLSHDGWMSCRSCHTDGQSNGLAVDTLSDKSFGAPKQTPSLLGVGETGPWTWLGTVSRLEEQVRTSVETTMRGRKVTDAQVADLTAYLRSLPAPRPLPVAGADSEAVERGREVFESRACARCHTPPGYNSAETFDVALPDEVGNRKFNPPSLRGVARRPPYLHDGRAQTLPDVFLRHRHPKLSGWSNGEVEDLVAYLKTL